MANTQYSVEYSPSSRATCSGPKYACEVGGDRMIGKGELRLVVSFEAPNGMPFTKFRHWRCVTEQVLRNMGSLDNLAGIDQLLPGDQERVRDAFERGYVVEQKAVEPAGNAYKKAAMAINREVAKAKAAAEGCYGSDSSALGAQRKPRSSKTQARRQRADDWGAGSSTSDGNAWESDRSEEPAPRAKKARGAATARAKAKPAPALSPCGPATPALDNPRAVIAAAAAAAAGAGGRGVGAAEPVAVKAEPIAVKAEPVAVKAEPVAVKAEPVAVKAEPVAVKAEPGLELMLQPVAVKSEPALEAEAEPAAQAGRGPPTRPPASRLASHSGPAPMQARSSRRPGLRTSVRPTQRKLEAELSEAADWSV